MADTPFCGGRWSEARYRDFVRRGIRQLFKRWGPKHDALESARRPAEGRSRRVKWEYQCAICRKWFLRKEVEVDHIDDVAKYEDLNRYVAALLCEEDGLQVCCKGGCHRAKTAHRRAAAG